MGVLLDDLDINEEAQALGAEHIKDQFWWMGLCRNTNKAQVRKIVEWLENRREGFADKRRHCQKLDDQEGAMIYGIKVRALSEVINYLKTKP